MTQFVVSPAVLGGLAGLVPGEKSPLSPLHIPNPPALTPEQHEALFEAGMLDQNGLVEPARLMLAALSEAPSFARVRLNAPAGYLDEAIHFTGEGTYSVGISNTPDGLVLSAPGDAGSIFSQIQEYTGSSSHEIPVWSVELLPLEMLCLAALMDLRRKAVLHAIVDQQPVVPLPCDAPAITNAIQSMWGNPQWLTNAIQNATAIRTPPAVALVQTALSALVEKIRPGIKAEIITPFRKPFKPPIASYWWVPSSIWIAEAPICKTGIPYYARPGCKPVLRKC